MHYINSEEMLAPIIKNAPLRNKIDVMILDKLMIVIILRAKHIVSFALNNPNTYHWEN